MDPQIEAIVSAIHELAAEVRQLRSSFFPERKAIADSEGPDAELITVEPVLDQELIT